MNFDRVLLLNSLRRQKGNATRRLQVIPFIVGKGPAGTALPRIITSADVRALTRDQTIQHLGGYRIAYPDDATDENLLWPLSGGINARSLIFFYTFSI